MKKTIIDRYNQGQSKFFYCEVGNKIFGECQRAVAEGKTLLYASATPLYELFTNPKYGWLKTFHENIDYQKEMYDWYKNYAKQSKSDAYKYLYDEYIMGNLDDSDNDLVLKPILDFMAAFLV